MAISAVNGRDKILLLFSVAVVILSTASYYLSQTFDARRCQALLHDGFYLNPSAGTNWQPSACMMHNYHSSDASLCLQDRRIVLIGGTATLGLFEAMARKFNPEYALPGLPFLSKGSNVMMSSRNVRLEFIWDPFLQGSELGAIRDGFDDLPSRPALTVVGLERDHLKKDADVFSWSAQVDSIMSDFRRDAAVRHRQSDSIVFTPLLEPSIARLSPSPIDMLNEVLAGFASKYGVDVAFSFNKILVAKDAFVETKYASPQAGSIMADVLLNYRCNSELPKHYPYASTCCNTYPTPNYIQFLGFLFVLAIVLAWFLQRSGLARGTATKFIQSMPDQKYYGPILIMGSAVVLCWYCDRTNVYGKEHKSTSPTQFFVLMGLITVVSCLFTTHTAEKDLPFLNRDQTDEWKGWMQAAILVYHYVGVSKTMWIYNYMRVMPTSYLFMTGYGHANYYLKKDDYSFKRFTATMLRLNLLNIILAYAMGNDWLLYYFAPLVTWNYFVILAILYPYRKYNNNTPFLLGKIFTVAVLNTAFYRTPGVLEFVWSILQTTLRMQGDMKEWRFRVMLDAYSAFPGMITGILFINWPTYHLPKSPHWPTIQRAATILSATILLAYAVFESSQPSKKTYTTKHPYVSWLPCTAFILLRNATPTLRRTHNKFFAWVGRGSLETFLLQFHIWLAADTAGLLTLPFLPPDQRLFNFALTTPLFLFVSSLVTAATGDVIQWVMGPDAKPARPPLPPSYKSHPNGVPFGGIASATATTEPTSMSDTMSEKVSSAVALNGQPVDIQVQDPARLEKGIVLLEEADEENRMVAWRGVVVAARGDLRVRMGCILLAMAVGNWTYYL